MLLPPPSRTRLSLFAIWESNPWSKDFSNLFGDFERAASADEVAYWEASGFNEAQIGFAIVNGAQNDDLRTVTKKVDYAEAFVKLLTRLEQRRAF